MVVYCFPTESDTTYMQVERSVPVKKYANTVDEKTIDNAEINYNVNGKASKVESIGKGFYKITGLQKKETILHSMYKLKDYLLFLQQQRFLSL